MKKNLKKENQAKRKKKVKITGEQVEHRPINWRLVRDVSRGTIKHFVLGIIGIVAAVLSAYAIPLVTSFTIDYVLIEYAEVGYSGGMVIAPWFEGIIEHFGGRPFLESHLYIMGILLVLMTAINAFAVYLRRSQVAYGAETLSYNMRSRLYTHLANVPYDYHKHISSGDIIQRCTSDVDTIRRFVQNQLLEIARTVVMIVAATIILFTMNAKLAAYSVMVMPLLAIASFVYFKLVKKQFTYSDEAEGKLSATIQENVSGMRVVRAFGQQKNELENFTEVNRDYRTKTEKLLLMLSYYWGCSDALGYIQIAISICFSIAFVLKGQISVGEMLVFASYTSMLVWPVRQLGRILADLGKASVSLGRIDEILQEPLESEPGSALTPEIKGDVEFKGVGFGYEDGQDVLKDISFTAKRGETIAILGSTGSGKSSLVQLLQRLYTCREGEILIDGVNINDIERHHLRRNIGIVLQEPFLYSRTIMENVRIVNPDAPAEEVYEATRIASVHDVISSFENGYDTVVGEKGVTLSGGQKQRVAIARMLMQKAPIIVLDDSMSAVDTETDAAIRDALHARRDSCTTFIISHRITTLCRADKILVLEGGRLVQVGTHDELLKQDGLYRRIADIQNLLEDELKSDEREVE
ncbi:MAG: ABC transporter ATP-binding protein [Christensenellaceae bacterium]|nr:ABC transporter ATP-binding protein [Christensenellaceae bacterium]